MKHSYRHDGHYKVLHSVRNSDGMKACDAASMKLEKRYKKLLKDKINKLLKQ